MRRQPNTVRSLRNRKNGSLRAARSERYPLQKRNTIKITTIINVVWTAV